MARPEPYLPKNMGRGGRWKSRRRVFNGVLFRQRTGIPWRDLPTRFGKWKTVRDRHRGWSADGTWDRIVRAVQADADAEGRVDWSMASVDSTSCRAHQHSAGARIRAARLPRRRGRPAHRREDEAPGRPRGGLTTNSSGR
ncbi:IS5 family transposase [Streptomyces sp. IMTB 2501]|nr:IS5 family transposase [Streptomyces sp. IMTB 2501]